MATKRKRISLSCTDCRRRRVKCDRTIPACLRCQKGGQADECKYVPYEGLENTPRNERQLSNSNDDRSLAGEETNDYTRITPALSLTTSAPALALPRADIDSTLGGYTGEFEPELELLRLTAASEQSQGLPTPASIVSAGPSTTSGSTQLDQNLLRGTSFKTQYFGPSHCASVLLRLNELTLFARDVMSQLRKRRLRSGIRASDNFKALRRNLERRCAQQSHSNSALLELLPDKLVVDSHLQSYMDSFEVTYRVLHVPSFARRYESFWQAPQDTPASFVVLLLLILASVHCISPQQPVAFLGRSSYRREQVMIWVTASEAWLDAQSQKYLTLEIFQTRILLFMAKRMNAIKTKRAWTSAGPLVRMAIDAGLHRNVEASAGVTISAFDQEMRRRLWATTLELELLTSMDKGIPPAVRPGEWDCGLPLNIHDEDFAEDSTRLPDARPEHHFTRTSWLRTASKSADLRIKILTNINAMAPQITIDFAVQTDSQIRRILSTIPQWHKDQAPHHNRQHANLAYQLSCLQLTEYIILLYQPLATSKQASVARLLSRAAFRDASVRILEIYSGLETTSPTGYQVMRLFHNDSFRAALCLCHDLCSSTGISNHITLNAEAALELLEHALSIQEARVMQLGEGFYAYWITASAVGWAHARLGGSSSSQSPKDIREQQIEIVVAKVLAIYEKWDRFQGRIEDVLNNDPNEMRLGPMLSTPMSQIDQIPVGTDEVFADLAGMGLPGLEMLPDSDLLDSFDLGDVAAGFWNFGSI